MATKQTALPNEGVFEHCTKRHAHANVRSCDQRPLVFSKWQTHAIGMKTNITFIPAKRRREWRTQWEHTHTTKRSRSSHSPANPAPFCLCPVIGPRIFASVKGIRHRATDGAQARSRGRWRRRGWRWIWGHVVSGQVQRCPPRARR